MTQAYAEVPPRSPRPRSCSTSGPTSTFLKRSTRSCGRNRRKAARRYCVRALLTAGEWQTAREFMLANPLVVAPETDQEEVARKIARYDLSALPVTEPGAAPRHRDG